MGSNTINMNKINRLIAISEALKQEYVSIGISCESIKVIPRGVPESIIVKNPPLINKSPSIWRLIYAGRLVEKKGVHIAIQVVHTLVSRGQDNIRLDVVGTGESGYTDSLIDLVKAHKLEKYVTFLGMVPQERLIESFSQYHAVLFPSIWKEPFGMVVIEAMAKGTPVIANYFGGPAEVIRNGIDGFLVHDNRPEEYADIIRNLINDPLLYGRIRQEASKSIFNNYRDELLFNNIEEYLIHANGAK